MPNPRNLVIADLLTATLNLNGARTFGPAAVPVDVSTIDVTFDTSQWSVGTTLTLHLELSLDGGQTFPENLKTPDETFQPPFVAKDHVTPIPLLVGWGLMDKTNPDRMIRVPTVTVNGPLHTTVTVHTQTS